MKRVLSVMLSFALLLSAAGCSSGQKEPQQPDTPNPQVQPTPDKPAQQPEGPELPEPTPEDKSLRILSVLEGTETESEWLEDVCLCGASWQTLALGEEDTLRYPKLAECLAQLNRETENASRGFVADNLEFATEVYNEDSEFFYGMTYTD